MEKVKVRVKAKIPEGKVGSEISLDKEKAILYQKRGRVDIVSFGKPEDITSDSVQSEEEPKVVKAEAKVPKYSGPPKTEISDSPQKLYKGGLVKDGKTVNKFVNKPSPKKGK